MAAPPMAAPKGVAPQTPRAPTAQADVAKHLVFFDWDKATLTPEARSIIASAAEEYKRTGAAKIVATGHTDLSGTPQYNLKLSERRADAVKAELVRLGVPATVITTIGKGGRSAKTCTCSRRSVRPTACPTAATAADVGG